MNCDSRIPNMPHLMWVYAGFLEKALSAATYLETTYELRKLGWRVTLVAAGSAGNQYIRGVEVLCIPMPDVYFIRHLLFHIHVLRLIMLQQTMPEIILFHQMSMLWLLPLRFIRYLTGKQRPLLVMDTRSVHMPLRSKEGWKSRFRGLFYNSMDYVANHWADGRLAITQRMVKSVCIPPEKLWGVWPSGVNLNRFTPAIEARQWPLPEEPIHLIHIGCLHYERNLMTLCRAVERANTEGMAFLLTLLGDGTEREDLEAFASRTADRIRVAPPIPHNQVWEMLAQAHVGVLPFKDEEKFRVSSPIKLFEFMAAGLPILATRIACHTDVVGDGEYAFWAEQADVQGLLAALRLIWKQRDLLSKMGSHAANAAQSWTWQESARKLKLSLEFGLASFH